MSSSDIDSVTYLNYIENRKIRFNDAIIKRIDEIKNAAYKINEGKC